MRRQKRGRLGRNMVKFSARYLVWPFRSFYLFYFIFPFFPPWIYCTQSILITVGIFFVHLVTRFCFFLPPTQLLKEQSHHIQYCIVYTHPSTNVEPRKVHPKPSQAGPYMWVPAEHRQYESDAGWMPIDWTLLLAWESSRASAVIQITILLFFFCGSLYSYSTPIRLDQNTLSC